MSEGQRPPGREGAGRASDECRSERTENTYDVSAFRCSSQLSREKLGPASRAPQTCILWSCLSDDVSKLALRSRRSAYQRYLVQVITGAYLLPGPRPKKAHEAPAANKSSQVSDGPRTWGTAKSRRIGSRSLLSESRKLAQTKIVGSRPVLPRRSEGHQATSPSRPWPEHELHRATLPQRSFDRAPRRAGAHRHP